MMGGCGVFGLLAGLVGILAFAGLLGVVVWAAAAVLPGRGAPGGRSEFWTDPAEETLRERFARGELSAEEFEGSLRILRGGPMHEDRANFGREAGER